MMLKQAFYSHALINRLVMDLSKESSVALESYFDLSHCIYRAFDIILITAQERKIQLIGEVDQTNQMDVIRNLLGDPRRFEQILVNLML